MARGGFALADPGPPGPLRRVILATRDAHGLYERFGFGAPKWANAYMDIVRPDIYLQAGAAGGPPADTE